MNLYGPPTNHDNLFHLHTRSNLYVSSLSNPYKARRGTRIYFTHLCAHVRTDIHETRYRYAEVHCYTYILQEDLYRNNATKWYTVLSHGPLYRLYCCACVRNTPYISMFRHTNSFVPGTYRPVRNKGYKPTT